MDQELKPLPVNIHNFSDLRLAQSWRVNPEALQQRIEAQQQALRAQQEQLQSLPPIALDCSDFAQIRARGAVLVDKSAHLLQLLNKFKVYLCRPYGFGTSIIMSMLEELFTHGPKQFEGLIIHNLWPPQERYPVVRVSLKGLSNHETSESELIDRFCAAFAQAGFAEVNEVMHDHAQSGFSSVLLGLNHLRYLEQQQESGEWRPKTIVLLLEDCDYPLLATLHDCDAFEHNCKLLHALYAWLYRLRSVRFTCVTGSVCFQQFMQSTDDEFTNISRASSCADLVGYTPAELELYFGPHLKLAAQRLNLSVTDLVAELTRHYGGFCFNNHDETDQVLCPWSINHFFQQLNDPTAVPIFGDYWAPAQHQILSALAWRFSPRPDFFDYIKEQGLSIELCHHYQNNCYSNQHLSDLLPLGLVSSAHTERSVNQCSFPNLEMERCYRQLFPEPVPPRVPQVNPAIVPLSLTPCEFRDLQAQGALLVDKTALLQNLVYRGRVYFARPDGFGATLLHSIYEELFTHGTEHFAGLAIDKQWHQKRYPVIRLSLAGLCAPNTLNAELMARWSAACVQAGLSELAALAPHCDEISTLIFKCSALLSQSQTRVVVLIADCDYPLTATLHQRKTLLANQELMRELFLQLSDMSQVHFMLLTGNLHYRIMEGNWGCPIANLSQHWEWAQLLGYTQQELEPYFAPYLTEAAARLELSLTELLTQLKRHYGGYCFNYYDPSAQVYCPWSLNHFFAQVLEPDKEPEFGTYWLQQTQLKPKLQALAQAFEPELQDLIQRQPGYFVSRYILSAEAQYIKLWQALNLGLISIKQMPEEDNSYGCPNLEMERSLQRIFELA